MVHGVPRTFDLSKPSQIARLASENNFQATYIARVRWLGSNNNSSKKAGTLVLSFLNKYLAIRIERSGIFLDYDYHPSERFKPRPSQCYKCLWMGHFGKWCRYPARCVKCNAAHSTNECPEGLGNVSSCVLCKEGLAKKTVGVSEINHTPFSMTCPYKSSWFGKNPLPHSC